MDETMKLELEREEKQRRGRLKELEEMVQRLQSENKKLLNQVGRPTKPPTTKIEVTPSEPSTDKPAKPDEVQDIINLNDLEEERNEDEWLYVSPVRPPTPQDKSITPDEWLKVGENENKKRSSIPGLDEVKKQLLCYAMDLELNTASSKQQNLLSPESSPKVNANLRRVQSLSNKTAQKYLDQVRTKRRSLDRTELSSSPTKEVGEEHQDNKNQQPVESLMKTYALNTSDIHASPNAVSNSSPSLKPRNMPIRAIIPPGKSTTLANDVQHQEKEGSPDDEALQKRATPPLEYAQKGPSQSPSPDYEEQREQYNRTGAIQVPNLRKSPVFPRRVVQPATHLTPSPPQQQQQHRQQLPHPSKTVSPKGSPLMSRRAVHEPSGSIRPPQGGGSMISRLSPSRTMGTSGSIKAPATGMARSSHTLGSLQQQQQQQQQQQHPVQQQHVQGNIAKPMGKPLSNQSSPLQQRRQLMGPGQSLRTAHHQQRTPTHRTAVLPRETVSHYQQKDSSEDSSWMEGCF